MERIIDTHPNYTISIDGVVTNKVTGKQLKWNINKGRNNETSVCLCKDGVVKRVKISHLVAKAFPEICGYWFNGCEVDHIDTNRLNNNAYNLRVTDRKGNMKNPVTRDNFRNAWTKERRKNQSERVKGDGNPTRQPGYWTLERRERVAENNKKRKK